MATPPRMTDKQHTEKWLAGQKWKTIVALPVLLGSALYEVYWVWGVMFIYWGYTSIISRDAFLIEPIAQDENPVLYWMILAMWFVFGALYVLAGIYPEY